MHKYTILQSHVINAMIAHSKGMSGQNTNEESAATFENRSRHEHAFIKDLDGQVTCSTCGAMDDDMLPDIFESQIDFE